MYGMCTYPVQQTIAYGCRLCMLILARSGLVFIKDSCGIQSLQLKHIRIKPGLRSQSRAIMTKQACRINSQCMHGSNSCLSSCTFKINLWNCVGHKEPNTSTLIMQPMQHQDFIILELLLCYSELLVALCHYNTYILLKLTDLRRKIKC